MKKLLSTILFLLPSLAMAIDKPIPCDGANCKLKFETRDGSNVKVGSGEVSGLGVWTLGPSTGGSLVHKFQSGLSTELSINSASGSNYSLLNQQIQGTGQKWTIGPNGNSDWSIYDTTGAKFVGSVTTSGAWTIGPSSYTGRHNVYGRLTVGSVLSVGGTGSDNGAAFFRASTSSNSCDTACQTEPSPLNTSSGSCLKAWDGSGNVAACATVASGTNCLCTGLY